MSYLLACAWLACLVVCFAGYGSLLLKLCRRPTPPFTLSAALGISLFVAFGGVLNLVSEIRPVVIIALVVAGLILALLNRQWLRLPRFRPGILLLTAALLVPVLGNIRADVRSFNIYDDLPAYLTLPVETLQLHTLPADPFNERRVTSCLGAPYFLQACLLSGNDVREIRAVDVSIGWILYTLLLLFILERLQIAERWRAPVAALILILPVYRLNATFVVLPAALFLALFVVLTDSVPGWRRAIPLSLLTAALCAIKSNYLPAALLACLVFYGGELVLTRRFRTLLEGFLWGACTLALLTPWMLDLHAKEGTYLFPLLGRGFDASAYGVVPLPNGSHHGVSSIGAWVWITTAAYAGPYVIALAALLYAWRRKLESNENALSLASLLLATIISVAALASSTGGESIGRYTLPFQIPALLLFIAYLFRWSVERNALWWRASAAIAALYALFLAALFGVHHGQYRLYLEDARVLTPKPDAWFSRQAETARIRALQQVMPEGAPVLARLFVTYPFDFQRNRVFVADYTGMASPPPGMPIGQSAQAVRAFLLAHGIRYLAYDYRRCMLPDDDPQTSLQAALADPARYGRHGWLYMQVKVTNSEQSLFAQLGRQYRRLYDDGTAFAVDLAAPSAP